MRKDKGERKLSLGEEQFTLKFNAGSLIQIENMTGFTSGEIQEELQKANFNVIRDMIFVGTRKFHRNDIKQPAEILPMLDDVDSFHKDLMTPLLEAYMAGFPGMANAIAEAEAEEARLLEARQFEEGEEEISEDNEGEASRRRREREKKKLAAVGKGSEDPGDTDA